MNNGLKRWHDTIHDTIQVSLIKQKHFTKFQLTNVKSTFSEILQIRFTIYKVIKIN